MKWYGVRWQFFLLLALFVGGGILLRVSPYTRTKGFFVFRQLWTAHCPWAAARPLADRLGPVFEPFVPVWIHVGPGVTMLLDPVDLIGQSILWSGEWEPQTWQALRRHLPVGGTFVDVGAHIGWYSLHAAHVVGRGGRVIAVEPNRQTLIQLADNIRASGAGDVIRVAPVACYDSEATLKFFAAPRENTGRSSLSRANASEGGPVADSYEVRARRLDDILRDAGVTRVDVIKIDVEGAEFNVLKGAVDTLDRDHPALSVEVIGGQLQAMGSSERELMEFMRSHGYAPTQYQEENMIFLAATGQGSGH